MLYVFLLILLSSSYSKKTYEKKCAKPECGCYSPYLSSECTDENHWLIHAIIPFVHTTRMYEQMHVMELEIPIVNTC